MRRDAEIPLMVHAGATAECSPPNHSDLVIEILDPGQAAVHAEVAAVGFGAPLEAFRQLTTPAVLGRPGVRTYVGRIDGEAVATSVGVCLKNHVGIFNVATLPAHRRRGYGAALTLRALRDGLARGAEWAWLQSTPDGQGIYEKLGFSTLECWQCWIAE
jgi:ribosomal protein S18 acetylase RimI-like enzyme